MKLILTQEVSGLGAPGDVVEVKDGFGRNYLVPRGLAIAWTRGGEKQVSSIKRARDARSIRDIDHAQAVKGQLEALKVSLSTRAGEAGRLFGSVTTADVAQAVQAAGGPVLDKRTIELTAPIKTVGAHQVSVKLHPEVAAKIEVEVVGA
jgi:large subunit ribosomal protein L9